MQPGPSLYDQLGGMPALRRLSDAFYERVLADELLAPVKGAFASCDARDVAVVEHDRLLESPPRALA